MKFKPIKTPKINTIKYYRQALEFVIIYAEIHKSIGRKESLEAVINTAQGALNKEPLLYELEEDKK